MSACPFVQFQRLSASSPRSVSPPIGRERGVFCGAGSLDPRLCNALAPGQQRWRLHKVRLHLLLQRLLICDFPAFHSAILAVLVATFGKSPNACVGPRETVTIARTSTDDAEIWNC